MDLYAGVGLFSVPLARRFREVTAVESGSRAVRDLRHNAERVIGVQGNAIDYLQNVTEAPETRAGSYERKSTESVSNSMPAFL